MSSRVEPTLHKAKVIPTLPQKNPSRLPLIKVERKRVERKRCLQGLTGAGVTQVSAKRDRMNQAGGVGQGGGAGMNSVGRSNQRRQQKSSGNRRLNKQNRAETVNQEEDEKSHIERGRQGLSQLESNQGGRKTGQLCLESHPCVRPQPPPPPLRLSLRLCAVLSREEKDNRLQEMGQLGDGSGGIELPSYAGGAGETSLGGGTPRPKGRAMRYLSTSFKSYSDSEPAIRSVTLPLIGDAERIGSGGLASGFSPTGASLHAFALAMHSNTDSYNSYRASTPRELFVFKQGLGAGGDRRRRMCARVAATVRSCLAIMPDHLNEILLFKPILCDILPADDSMQPGLTTMAMGGQCKRGDNGHNGARLVIGVNVARCCTDRGMTLAPLLKRFRGCGVGSATKLEVALRAISPS
ncbi:hypothetical protein R3P38DRAFT_2760470 [Favolaschia claudopus]|uniref:Uncharacterized protein n=1 Tax=Favolaschia claudopus TaxID=2862362 RepID=A0AAW0DR72_9AGAR